MRATLHLLCALALLTTSTAKAQRYSTSWIANDGGWEESHIPHDMLGLYVHPDGTVATICGWDEGGTNVGVFRNGQLISRPEGSGTGGWGRHSGVQVVMDARYVYQLLTQHGCDGGNDKLNDNGLRQFPPCSDTIEWKTIRRYHRENGLGAPFATGYGYKGDMLVVATQRQRHTLGLAIDSRHLYVALSGDTTRHWPDSIKIYQLATMTPAGGYPLDIPGGQLACDGHGGLWMMSGKRIVRMKAATGKRLRQEINIPSDVVASSFTIDAPSQRLFLPNRGRDLDIRIYGHILDKPAPVGHFGQKGGVFARDHQHLQGEAGPRRFSGPTGAGVDAQGHLYVCCTTVSGGRGAVLEAYDEQSGHRLWQRQGLIFTATADADRADVTRLFTPEKIHIVQPTLTGTRQDTLLAYTANPFAFPQDERVIADGAFITTTWHRRIQGHEFLFVSDMYGGMLAGYRFDAAQHGYVGIPFLFANNGDPGKRPLRFWADRNGDAQRQDTEWLNADEVNPYSMSFFVDQAGNVWHGSREQGLMLWQIKGLDAQGLPIYTAPRHIHLPPGTNGVKRLWYDSQTDELFLAGFSAEKPDKGDTWWCMGSTIARYPRFLATLHAGQEPQPALTLHIPFNPEDGTGRDHTNAKAFCVEGDYIFVALARHGIVHIYNRTDGRLVGQLQPDQSVHGQSGWADFNYCINAHRLSDGTYRVYVEENAFAKVLVYHIQAF